MGKTAEQESEPLISSGCSIGLLLASIGLASVIYPNHKRGQAQGSMTACKSNLKNIGSALEMYADDHEEHYPKTLRELVPTYLKVLPTCPQAEKATYKLDSDSESPHNEHEYENFYHIYCSGSNHTPVNLPENHPAYDSIGGFLEPPKEAHW